MRLRAICAGAFLASLFAAELVASNVPWPMNGPSGGTAGDLLKIGSDRQHPADAGTIYSYIGSQSANTVLAAPNGSSGNPSFRALVGADLPGSGITTINGVSCTIGSSCSVMRETLAGGATATQATNVTAQYPVMGSQANTGLSDAQAHLRLPYTGTVGFVTCDSSAAPGTGFSFIYTLLVNGSAPVSGPVCTISDTATVGVLSGSAAAVSSGDFVSMRMVSANGAAAARPNFSLSYIHGA